VRGMRLFDKRDDRYDKMIAPYPNGSPHGASRSMPWQNAFW